MKGGRRKKSVFKTGQEALLDAIWRSKGGATKVASVIGVHPQTPINWRNRGGVPLVLCPEISKKLSIYEWGLNYKELSKFYGLETTPKWLTVVKGYGLPVELVKFILQLPAPEL